ANPKATLNVIVLGQPDASMSALREHANHSGAKNIKEFSVIPGMVMNIAGWQLASVASDPAVRSITPNGRVKGQSITSGLIWPQATGVDTLWGSSPSPAPAAPAIAVVDSGADAGKAGFQSIAPTVDLTGTPGARDDDGHGTLVASIAAGASSKYPGASPTSRVYPLRVVRSDGTAYAADVIEAADWVYKNAFKDNIRVANFSLSSSSPNYAMYDPIDAAVRQLWLSGTVVVTSAGNDGPGRMLYAPGNEPFVITVGAADIADTVDRADDSNAPWTSSGYTPEGFAKPELSAPGRWMIGAIPAKGNTLATMFPDRIVSPGYMWMSGTSFSAPVVSGVAAQM